MRTPSWLFVSAVFAHACLCTTGRSAAANDGSALVAMHGTHRAEPSGAGPSQTGPGRRSQGKVTSGGTEKRAARSEKREARSEDGRQRAVDSERGGDE